MSGPAERSIRRILLAQGIAGLQPAALELALRLATRHGAELAHLVVEELELLNAAALPGATEVLRHSGEQRPLDGGQLRRLARENAEALRTEHGHRHGLTWSLRVVRGDYPGAPAQALRRGDLLVLGEAPHAHWGGTSPIAPALLVYADAAERNSLEAWASELAGDGPGPARPLEIVPRPEPELILAALRRHRPYLVMSPATPTLLEPTVLRRVLKAAACPVILLPREEGPEIDVDQ